MVRVVLGTPHSSLQASSRGRGGSGTSRPCRWRPRRPRARGCGSPTGSTGSTAPGESPSLVAGLSVSERQFPSCITRAWSLLGESGHRARRSLFSAGGGWWRSRRCARGPTSRRGRGTGGGSRRRGAGRRLRREGPSHPQAKAADAWAERAPRSSTPPPPLTRQSSSSPLLSRAPPTHHGPAQTNASSSRGRVVVVVVSAASRPRRIPAGCPHTPHGLTGRRHNLFHHCAAASARLLAALWPAPPPAPGLSTPATGTRTPAP